MYIKPSKSVDKLMHLTQLFENQIVLLENNKPVKFECKFTKTNHEILPWMFAAEKYLRTNGFTAPKIPFQRIFP